MRCTVIVIGSAKHSIDMGYAASKAAMPWALNGLNTGCISPTSAARQRRLLGR